MNYQDFFKNPSIQAFLLTAILLYFIFRLIQYLNRRFVLRTSHRKNVRKALYFVEFFSWLIFISESVNHFITNNILLAVLLSVVLVIVIGWTALYVIKDFVVGLYIKWNDIYKINESIQFKELSGKIIKLGSRTAVLETSPLHTTKIPYSQLFTKNVIKTRLTDLYANASFILNVSSQNTSPEKLDDIRTYIYQLPWVNFKYKPVVAFENQDKENTTLRISASLHDEKYLELFESKIRKEFEK